ncbi:MAG: tail fiber domain-containing protein, partial [Bacteroidia bacterium]|nr:tail fiber domain-containing protein [Bacteroidia bacterium]
QVESTVATFDLIDWSVTPIYLKTEIYYSGSWKDMGTSQLMSVPYALKAKDSDQWTTSGSNIYRASGNVGIGTTVPGGKLHVNGNALIEGIIAGQYSSGYGTALLVGNDSKLEDINVANTMGIYGMEDVTQGHIKLGSSGPTISGVLGNVGIGTTNPGSYKLNVNGGSVLINDGTGISGTLKLAGHSYIGSADWGNLSLSAGSNGGNAAIFLNTENATRLTISGGGNVGIGTTNPVYKLEVNGGIGSSGLLIANGVQSGLMIYKTDNSADQRSTELVSLGASGNFVGRFVNDAYTQADAWINVARNTGTYTVNSVTFPSGKVGIGTVTSSSKLAIQPESSWSDEVPLFEVKNKSGVPVLAVYNNGVRILIDHTIGKGVKTGFAVGGYDMTKAGETTEMMIISPDSVRFYIDNDDTKGIKSGFAVGGFDLTKGTKENFLDLTSNNTTEGLHTVAIGYQAGMNSKGTHNTLFGVKAGLGVSGNKGTGNIFIGEAAGRDNNGSFFTALQQLPSGEYITAYISAGGNNIAIGNYSGLKVTGALSSTEGSYNVLVGNYTGTQITTGQKNVMIGNWSGYSTTTGSGNIFIGCNSGRNETGSNLLYIDNAITSSPLVWGDFISNVFRINGSIEYTGTITDISDSRLKNDIRDIDNVLSKIKSLRGVYYEWDKIGTSEMIVNNGRQIGVIAQEVEKEFPELVVTNNKGYKMVDYIKLTPILLQGMKEQQQEIEIQNQKIDSQQQQIDELSQMILEMREEIASSSL